MKVLKAGTLAHPSPGVLEHGRGNREHLVGLSRQGATRYAGCPQSSARIAVTRVRDRGTPESELGIKWRVIGGPSVPSRLRPVPPFGWRLMNGVLEIEWDDEPGDPCNLSPVAFDVVLITVDRAGNESRPSRPIRIAHPGHDVRCE